jgi:hypothetical protein
MEFIMDGLEHLRHLSLPGSGNSQQGKLSWLAEDCRLETLVSGLPLTKFFTAFAPLRDSSM